jgi:hypothetical protein
VGRGRQSRASPGGLNDDLAGEGAYEAIGYGASNAYQGSACRLVRSEGVGCTVPGVGREVCSWPPRPQNLSVLDTNRNRRWAYVGRLA